jgi:hypothetical protein
MDNNSRLKLGQNFKKDKVDIASCFAHMAAVHKKNISSLKSLKISQRNLLDWFFKYPVLRFICIF